MGEEEKPSLCGQPPPPLGVAVAWEDVESDRTFRWKRRPLEPLVDNGSRPGEQDIAPAVAVLRGVDLPTDGPSCPPINGPAAPRGCAQVPKVLRTS